MSLVYERRVSLEGSHNFRDLGGYESMDGRVIRWRRIFRSDALHRLTPGDIAHVRDEIGLVSVFDLRSEYELEHDGLGSLYEHTARHRHTPFHRGDVRQQVTEIPDDLGPLYLRMLEEARPSIVEVFNALAEADSYPAVYHCTAGKDRTGVMTALILRALGVDDESIIADYVLSSEYITPHLEARLKSGDMAQYPNIKPSMLRAEAGTMAATLAVIDEQFGPGTALLQEYGIGRAQIERLQDQLLIEPGARV